MALNLVQFNNIDGVPIHYARAPVANYGTKGKGPRNVRLDKTFFNQLQKCLAEIWGLSPWGAPEVLVSGGCYVEKAGTHGLGRAIDIDAIWWKGKPGMITKKAPDDALRYLAVESILHKHFGIVLDFWYNGAHEDHWHVDNGREKGYRSSSRAQALFIQAALTYVYELDIGDIDGVVGKKTTAALKKVRSLAEWDLFLVETATMAFSKA